MKSKAENIIKEFRLSHPGRETYDETHIKIFNSQDQMMGFIDYHIDESLLTSSTIVVTNDFKKQGVSKALLAYFILRHPEVTEMDLELTGTNEEILEQEISKGKSLLAAFQETPAYRIRKAFGFSEIEILDERSHRFRCKLPMI